MIDEAELLAKIDKAKFLAKGPALSENDRYLYVVPYVDLLQIISEMKGDK